MRNPRYIGFLAMGIVALISASCTAGKQANSPEQAPQAAKVDPQAVALAQKTRIFLMKRQEAHRKTASLHKLEFRLKALQSEAKEIDRAFRATVAQSDKDWRSAQQLKKTAYAQKEPRSKRELLVKADKAQASADKLAFRTMQFKAAVDAKGREILATKAEVAKAKAEQQRLEKETRLAQAGLEQAKLKLAHKGDSRKLARKAQSTDIQ